jgi:two-component system response regulator RegA
VVDLKLQESSGLDLVPQLAEMDSNMVIVVLTGYGSITTAVTAIKRGAANYLSKPVRVEEVISALGEPKPEAAPKEEGYSPMSVERVEWEHIQKVLQENDGNISATARSLGMHRRTLQRKLAKKPRSE